MSRGIKTAIIIGGVIVGLIIVLSIVSGSLWDRSYGWWGPGMMGGSGWMWFLPMLLFMAVVGLIIWAVVSAVGRSSASSEPKSGDSALEILRQRYARGDISREEYEAKRKDLTQ